MSRFDLGYNAAHALALAALRAQGYRSDSRYQVFQCLQHTVGLPREQWRVLDDAHRKRNIAGMRGCDGYRQTTCGRIAAGCVRSSNARWRTCGLAMSETGSAAIESLI